MKLLVILEFYVTERVRLDDLVEMRLQRCEKTETLEPLLHFSRFCR